MAGKTWSVIVAVALFSIASSAAVAQDEPSEDAIEGLRLYVLDGGVLASDPTRYRLSTGDVAQTSLSIAAYLIAHPLGVLLWDAGAIADAERAGGVGVEQRIVRPDGQERFVTLGPRLVDQLAAAGFAPGDVTHLALSHYHWDHTADANAFAEARWLVSQAERERMFSADPPGGARPGTYASLETGRTQILTSDEHDVFGDGSVVIKRAPGHTEGHQVLYVRLARTGAVVLSGDLYHYAEERTLARLPVSEVSEEQTAASRADVEAFLARTGAELWIQHDLVHHRTLRLAPEYYD